MAKLTARWRYNPSMRGRKLLKLTVQQKVLLTALIVVAGSLTLLTLLQYRSLAEIEDKTKLAYRETLRQQSGSVEREVRSSLREFGELLPAAQNIELRRNADEDVREFLSRIKNSNSKVDRV